MFAQEGKIYKEDQPIQKTLTFNESISTQAALMQFGKLYNLDVNNTFEGRKATSDISGLSHQRFQQFYKGLKIEFGMVITHSRDGKVVSINGELYNPANLNLTPNLTAEAGLQKAINSTLAQKYLWEDKDQAEAMEYKKPTGELVIFPKGLNGELRLAYKYDVYALQPISREEIFIDAHSGAVLYRNPIIKHANGLVSPKQTEEAAKAFEVFATGSAATRYSGTKSIETTLDAGLNKYVLLDNTRGNGIVTYNSGKTNTYPSTHFVNTTNTWNTGNYASGSSTKDNAALDAHWGAEMTYDFWKNVFNRNSFDDANSQIKSYVHYDDTPATTAGMSNAFWNGTAMSYGDGSTKPFTSIDVCGHEIGHAICTYTANLAYQNQSGGMNEGFSDIWGACIEHYGRTGSMTGTPVANVWIVGEDISTTGLRSMSNPNSKGDPDCIRGSGWTTTADDGNCTPVGPNQPGANDYCGVHTNSGVLNYWFYLLTAGGSGTNDAPIAERDTYSVTGIGLSKAAQIAYFTERDYLTSNSTYADARNGSIAVAKNLFGCGSAEHLAVMNAWFAVNVGSKYTDIDLNLSSITGDSNVACGASHSFSFNLQNFGSPSISSATITYSIDGGAQVPVTWTGSDLSACTNPVQNYSIPLGTLSKGTHAIVVTTTLAGDTDTSNNSKTTYITVNESGTVNTINTFNSATDALVSIDASGKANSVWERGTVVKSLLTDAIAGSQVYATKLSDNYPDKTTSYLVSQCYDLSGLANPTVSFDMAFDLEPNWDIIYFEYSTNNGSTWNVLGTSSDTGWYNSSRLPDGADCFNCIGKQWTGNYASAPAGSNGVNGNKRNYSHTVPASDNTIFRFVFKSDDAANQEGVIIDNFEVQGVLSTSQNQFDSFGVYPNPSNGLFNVVLSTSEKVNIVLYDLSGRSIYNQNFSNKSNVFNQELNFNTLSSGVYILNVESAGKKASRRIIIN